MKKKSRGALRPAARKLAYSPRMAAVSALMAASMLAANLAFADPAKATVNIPPQELSSALKALASQTNSQLLFATDALQGARTKGVSGSYTPEEALQLLLKGTPYSYRTTAANTFTVQGEAGKKQEAAAADRRHEQLPEVVVTATKTERLVTEVPASVSVITAKDIESQQVEKAVDLLRNVEGIDIRSPVGRGTGFDAVNIRGVRSSSGVPTTQILVDGMPVEPILVSVGAGLDFSGLDDIERIEVVRGPASALYGPNAMGGVVNVMTKRWTGKPGGEVGLGLGSHDAQSLHAAVGGASEKFDLRISASEYRTDGYRVQPDINGDLAGRDWRDQKKSLQLGLYPTQDQEITFGFRNYDLDSAILGGRPNYRQDRQGNLYDIGYKLDLGDIGNLKLKYLVADVTTNIRYDGFSSPDADTATGDPTDFTYLQIDRNEQRAETFEAQANLRVAAGNLLTIGLSRSSGEQKETSDFTDGSASALIRAKSEVTGLYAQDEIRVSDRMVVTVGARYDRYRLFGSEKNGTSRPDSTDSVINPRLGLNYKLAAHTSVYASYGTAYLPALATQRYRLNSARFRDNPDLAPESSKSYELGLNQGWEKVSARVALFHTDYHDKIESIRLLTGQNCNGVLGVNNTCSQSQNIGEVKVDGIEFALEGRAGLSWRPYLNYAYTDSRTTRSLLSPQDEGKQSIYNARHKLNLGMLYAPSRDLTARLSGRYGGDIYATTSNTPASHAGGHFVADFKVSKRIPLDAVVRDAELSFAINNLFDRTYYNFRQMDSLYELGDGRNYWLGLNARF